MHHVIERFVGRYEVWRRAVPLRNPLNIPALVLVTSIVQAVYQIATSHHAAWGAVVLLAVDITFLLLYVRRSPSAWLVLPVWGVMALIQLPFAVISSFPRYPLGVSLVATSFLLIIGVRLYRMGVRDSAAILRVRRIRAGTYTSASNPYVRRQVTAGECG